MTIIRYIPHPDDALLLDVEIGEEFRELKVYYDTSDPYKPFITQVNDRMTVEDEYANLFGEHIRPPE